MHLCEDKALSFHSLNSVQQPGMVMFEGLFYLPACDLESLHTWKYYFGGFSPSCFCLLCMLSGGLCLKGSSLLRHEVSGLNHVGAANDHKYGVWV